MPLRFEKRSTVGRPWFKEVWNGRELIGTIGETGGLYSYFHGPHNVTNASLTDPDLADLERKIEVRHGAPASN